MDISKLQLIVNINIKIFYGSMQYSSSIFLVVSTFLSKTSRQNHYSFPNFIHSPPLAYIAENTIKQEAYSYNKLRQ